MSVSSSQPINPAIVAIVPAAGLSKRMGRFKPLLQLGALRTVERVIQKFADAGVEHVMVVSGHRAAEIGGAVAGLGVCCVHNPNYLKGMFTSITAGIRALPEGTEAFFIHPVDIPLVRSHTIRTLAAAAKNTPAAVVYPTFEGRRGHPTLISARLKKQILSWNGSGGLRAFLHLREAENIEIPVADEGILMDLDTPDDHARILARLEKEGLPSEAECHTLLNDIRALPPAVVAHCRAVAGVAQRLAAALLTAGADINVDLVRAAALLHDIARTEKDHARAGAKLLKTYGFMRLVPIVRTHMDLEVKAGRPVDEAQIVFLADKLVGGDQRVDLEQRFEHKMKKYGQTPLAQAQIERRRENARRIKTEVEQMTGLAIEEILAANG